VDETPILEARGIDKRFGHVTALRGSDFIVRPGEIVALIGDNGAGKSTLVKILSGAVRPDAGQLLIEGRPVDLVSPADAQRAGISTVFQDLSLAPDLAAAPNMFLGRELLRPGLLGRLGMLDKKAMAERTRVLLSDLGVQLRSTKSPVVSCSGGQRQSIAVARAVAWATKVLLLDEPTAALGVVQTRNVHDLIRRIRDEREIAIVLITHNMPEVLELSDRVEVLRLGRRVAQMRTADASVERMVGAMTGAISEEVGR
jgi:simple sugar transport system ATP-binding protein